MTEMKEICGICSCGEKLELRIQLPEKGEEILIWIIYGICKKENLTIFQAIFFDEKPKQNKDYFINTEKKCDINEI